MTIKGEILWCMLFGVDTELVDDIINWVYA